MFEQPWWGSASCQRLSAVEKDNFFAESKARQNVAKRVCRSCPVVSECLFFALENREQEGIWGETTPRERRRMLGLLASAGPNALHSLTAMAT